MTDKSSPANSTSHKAKPKSAPEQPVSILEFLRNTEITPKMQAGAAQKAAPPELSQEQRQEAVKKLLGSDASALVRLEALMVEMLGKNLVLAEQVFDLAEGYLAAVVGSMPASDPGKGNDALEEIRTVIQKIRTHAKESRDRKRQEISIRMAIYLTLWKYYPGEEAFTQLVLETFAGKSQARQGQAARPKLAEIVAAQLHRESARDPVLQLVAHYGTRLSEAAATVRRHLRRIEDLESVLNAQQQENEELRGKVAKLQGEVDTCRQRIASQETDLVDLRAVMRQTEKQLKARWRGVLQRDLQDLLRDVEDAASVDPAPVHIIRDRIVSVRRILEKEVTWLASSD